MGLFLYLLPTMFTGKLLIAAPSIIGDPNFHRSVIIITQHKNSGTIGFILNNKLSWGTQYDKSQDVLRVPAAVTTEGASSFERFTIYFDTLTDKKAHLNLQWGKTMTAIPITVK